MPRKPLAIPELRSTPGQRAAQLAWARKYYQQHIAPIDKLWGECERRTKERMMETINAEVVERRDVPPIFDGGWIVIYWKHGWLTTDIFTDEFGAQTFAKQYNAHIFHLALPAAEPAPDLKQAKSCSMCGFAHLPGETCECLAPAPAPPSVGDVLDRLRGDINKRLMSYLAPSADRSSYGEGFHYGINTMRDEACKLIDEARREAGK